MSIVLFEAKLAWRRLGRRRGHTALIFGTFAFSITLVLLSWSLFRAVVLRPPPYDPDGTLYVVGHRITARAYQQEVDAWAANQTVFSEFVVTSLNRLPIVASPEGSGRRSASMLPAAALRMVHARPLFGRLFTEDEDRRGGARAALLGYSFWRSHYRADRNVLGQSLVVDGLPSTIVGVMPPDFRFPDEHDLWLSGNFETRPAAWFNVLARLKPGISRERAQADLAQITSNFPAGNPTMRRDLHPYLLSFRERYLPAQVTTGAVILFALALLFVAMSSLNTANLVLMDFLSRTDQVAISTAIGLPPWANVRSAALQVFYLTGLASLTGVACVVWLGPSLFSAIRVTGMPAWIQFTWGPELFGVAALVGVVSAIIAVAAPAIVILWTRPEKLMRSGFAGRGTGRTAWRHGLLVVQIGLLTVLGCTAGLLLKSQNAIARIPLGFEPERVLSVGLAVGLGEFPDSAVRTRLFERLAAELSRVPGVAQVAFSDCFPGNRANGNLNATYDTDRSVVADKSGQRVARMYAATDNYISTLKIPWVAGGMFPRESSKNSPDYAVINRSLAARLWPAQDPVGRVFYSRLRSDARGHIRELTVSGVVEDHRSGILFQPALDAIYTHYSRDNALGYFFFLRGSDRVPSPDLVRRAVRNVDPRIAAAEMMPYRHQLDGRSAMLRLMARLTAVFTIAAVLLGIMGVYSLTAALLAQRTREYGIRLALGATPELLWRSLMARHLVLVGLGAVLGGAAAAVKAPILAAFLYEVTPRDFATFVVVGLTVMAVAALACLPMLRRLRQLNPSQCLRSV